MKNRYSLTHEAQTVVIRMGHDEIHYISVLHQFRYDRKKWIFQRNADKWQDVLVAKPLPPNNLFDKELMVKYEWLFLRRGKETTHPADISDASCIGPENFYCNTMSIKGRFVYIRKAACCERRGPTFIECWFEQER